MDNNVLINILALALTTVAPSLVGMLNSLLTPVYAPWR